MYGENEIRSIPRISVNLRSHSRDRANPVPAGAILPSGTTVGFPMLIRLLAALPFLGILVGSFFFNRVEPLILGMPTILAWLLLWIVLTSAIMALIYVLDPENRGPPDSGTRRSAGQ